MARRATPNELKVNGSENPRTTPTDAKDPLRNYTVTVKELERLVRAAKGRTFFVYAGQFAASPNQEGVSENYTRGKSVSANIIVSKNDALKYIESAYGFLREQGYTTGVTISSRCFFIG